MFDIIADVFLTGVFRVFRWVYKKNLDYLCRGEDQLDSEVPNVVSKHVWYDGPGIYIVLY
jgi:hypothetical protein